MRKKQLIVGMGLLVNKAGKMLITLRNDPENSRTHNKWEIPGGKVEFGETIKQAVKREMKEEVGVDVEFLKRPPIITTNIWKNPTVQVQVFLIGYLCRTNQNPYPANDETMGVKWVDAEDIVELDYLPKCDEVITKVEALL